MSPTTINNSGTLISTSGYGLSQPGLSVVNNSGAIYGLGGVNLSNGGTVSNSQNAVIAATSTAGVGVLISGAAGTISNAGSVSAAGTAGIGVQLAAAGADVSNTSGGNIWGGLVGIELNGPSGSVSNSGGQIGSPAGAVGVLFVNGGSLTNGSQSTILGSQVGVAANGAPATVTNNGLIAATGSYNPVAVLLNDGGSVTNGSGSVLTGARSGVFILTSGTISNQGTISATGTVGYALNYIQSGSVTNYVGALISATKIGLISGPGPFTLLNQGTISGDRAVQVGEFKKPGTGNITNAASALISGGLFGVLDGGGTMTLANSGVITAANYGVDIGNDGGGGSPSGDGFITNASGASISGGVTGVRETRPGGSMSLTNLGTITGTSADGVNVQDIGAVTNSGSASISGNVNGIYLGQGSVTNDRYASITGGSIGVSIGTGTVINSGTISGGTYAVSFSASNAAANRLIVEDKADFDGMLQGGGGTLEFAGHSRLGAGAFQNFATVVVDADVNWQPSGSVAVPTVLNDGTITISGALDVTTAVDPTSSGLFKLDSSGASLEVAADTSSLDQIKFAASGLLAVDNVAAFGSNVGSSAYAGPTLQKFGSGDTIDLKNFAALGATFSFNASTGVLQLADSAGQLASLAFDTSSLGKGAFHLTSDGSTGVLVTHS